MNSQSIPGLPGSRKFAYFSTCKLRSAFLSIVTAIILCSSQSHAQGVWHPIADSAPHYNNGVMLLMTDGTVLVKNSSGSSDVYGRAWDKLTPDAYGSYIHGTWSTIAKMTDSRLYFSSQVLKDGSVYIAGGEYGTGRTRGERYYPQYDAWEEIALPVATDTISDANSEILDDGRVLQATVIAGSDLSHHTYIYDPATTSYTAGPPTLGSDNESAWLKLPDNSILFMDIYASTAERYIPATHTWVSDANVPISLYDPYGFETGAAFMLPDGRGFFIGSVNNTAYYTPSGSSAHGTWAIGPHIPDSLGAPDAAAAMMVNGHILCAFAHTPTSDSTVFQDPMSFYDFNYGLDSFTRIPAPNGMDTIHAPSYNSNMLCLPDGSVLYGSLGSDKYYVYQPEGAPLAAGKPKIDSIIRIGGTCDSFLAIGKGFNGITEGAAYGDDWQMSTNYPLVRLSLNDAVYYAPTYNWTSTVVMRGNKPDTTVFVLPAGMADLNYALKVVANGNPSDSVSFNPCGAALVSQVSNVTGAKSALSVYPNPASRQVVVEYTAKAIGKCTIRLIDVYGQVVKQEIRSEVYGKNTFSLQLTEVKPGAYTVELIDGSGVSNTKLMVQ